MPNLKKRKGTTSVLQIEGEMTIYRAAELKETLLATLDKAAGVEIDLSKVTDIDTAGVQLLILAKQSAQAKQQDLHLVAHSPIVLEVLELLNLATYFGDPLFIPAQ